MRRMFMITLTVLALGAVTSWLAPAQAQQPAPPPTWKQGQPAEMVNSPLAPVAQPPSPKAPGEIPVARSSYRPASRPACGRTASTTHGS